ncbi:MAG: hypothetical protein COX65_05995 [Elusimicrobia bacterium CG_4_10_14_0_2_um_filter_56_8]|nr:MAG: hypothetical protein AUJ51_12865 [Elusimicrobia bacterium CG1_02_56_21]PJA14268.1 MAG: hypothetical protein COX65_05995 [Elusimicrobia bacterium CG_4_10_14_0_2_um_filter_56_8]
MENPQNKQLDAYRDGSFDLETIPEPLRELIKARLEAAKTRTQNTEDSKIKIDTSLQFHGGEGLASILKLLVKVSEAQKARARPEPLEPHTEAVAAKIPAARDEPLTAGPVKPSSSGWALWLSAILLAAYHFLR